MTDQTKTVTSPEKEELIDRLRQRFESSTGLHPEIDWSLVESKLLSNQSKLWSLAQMEATGGEPSVVGYDTTTNEYIFCDCSKQSPDGRRSLCYDKASLDSRKEHKPRGSAQDMAKNMGIELLDEEQYRELQKSLELDTTTSSWISTPEHIRKLGGALYADRRYDTVFVYHNGAESYYAARGFRGVLRV
jgi:hypothetical protein